MKLARGLVSIAMSTVRDQSPTLPTPDYSPDPGVILADIVQKVSEMEVILERKADADKVRSLVAISDEAMLLQARQIILAGEVRFVDLLEDWNGTKTGVLNSKLTTIRAGVIRTQQLLSTNWGELEGSCIDLDDGKVIFGGSENPGLLYTKETGLVIDGAVTADSFILNGSSEPPTLGDLVDLAENAITTEDFLDELNEKLAAGVDSVLAGMNGNYRLELGTSSIILAHKDANLSGIGSSYTGDLRTGVAISANGIAMGFNRKSDGEWVNSVAINASGDAVILGTLTAGSVIAGDVTVNSVSLSTVVSNAAAGKSLSDTLLTSGTAVLKGVIQPQDSGALKVGTITWNATTGVLTGGTGIAITEWGIIGAASGVPTFSIQASNGNATFSGQLSAATGTFAGSLSAVTGSFYGSIITSGQVKATGSTAVTGGSNGSIVGQPASNGVAGVIGAAQDSAGILGLSNSGYGGIFNGGGGGLYAYTLNNTPAGVFSALFGAPAIKIDAGRIVKPRTTGHYIKIWATATPDQFEYELV